MAEPGVINQAALDTLLEAVGGDEAFLAELIDSYLDDSPRQLKAMQAALSSGDADGLRRAAHSLKSTSANFGAMHLARICKEIEEIAKRGSLEGAAGRVAQALDEYQRVEAALLSTRPVG